MPQPSASPINLCGESCPCRNIAARHDPLCVCGLSSIGDVMCPYCPKITHRAAPQKQKSDTEIDTETDTRLREAYRQGWESGAPQAAHPAEVPAARKPRRKRRSKEEMAEVRAEAADRIRRVRRRVTPDWLADQDGIEDQFVASLNATETE